MADVTEQEAREAASRAQGSLVEPRDVHTIFTWAVRELARREAERAELETTLRELLKMFDGADESRLVESNKHDAEAEARRTAGDMCGWNFHKGVALGGASASIMFFRVRLAIQTQLDLLAALKGGAS